MCYSAQIEADYKKFVGEFGAVVDMETFTQLWLRDNNKNHRPKTPRALDLSFLRLGDSSVAAIADEPEPEVAAAGHDRTIINIKPEHIEAWLNPAPANLQALRAIFDDKRPPFYVHRIAA